MIDAATRASIVIRAGNRCEFCHFPQSAHPERFPVDHIIPRKHLGTDDASNLALCCPLCNWHKGPNLTGIDSADGSIVRLFHPRTDVWEEHFEWNGAVLRPRTSIGRVTIAVLNINDGQRVQIREMLR